MDFYGFYTGKIFNAHHYFGAHISENGTVFRVFAPQAISVSVIGDFNNWTETPMQHTYNNHFWECTINNATEGMRYKYRITKNNGTITDHCDPYGYSMEKRPDTASIICDLSKFKFNDSEWLKKRCDCKNKPLNIYELHLGSWRRKSEMIDDWYSYSELAELLIPYLKENGYNYIEIMPLGEHPCDESWGYQCTGFFSPTSRYGTPLQLKYFINQCHTNNIGVLLDFVPVHFAVDDYALKNFDGTSLYEYPNSDVGNSEWGSCNFMHSRGEVRSFLQSCAEYWISEYHFDGLRMDAISNMIYWQGNPDRGINYNAVDFLRYMNNRLKDTHPDIILSAEDSTSFPKVTKPILEGGLGFDYKWDMGWMNDTLSYFKSAPLDRSKLYHKLTFSMMYFPKENYLMPLSHDEVVHGKGTIIQKMYGSYEDKFAQARALYMYMYAHPGKKLNFMGNEIGQFREWNEKREQDWDLVKNPIHFNFHKFMQTLNNIYLSNSALYEQDYNSDGFKWIDCHNEKECIYAFERISPKQRILALFNFSDKTKDYELKNYNIKSLKLLLSSEFTRFDKKESTYIVNEEVENVIKIKMPQFSAKYYIVLI